MHHPQPSRHRAKRTRRLAGLALGLIASLFLGLGLTTFDQPQAEAVPSGYVAPYTWMPGDYGNSNGGTYLGRLVNTDPATKGVSPYAVCITAGAASPTALKLAGTQTGGVYSQMGYVLAKHLGETGNNTPQAISYLAHLNFDTGNGRSADSARALIRQNAPKAAGGAAIVARANELWAEAAALQGVPKLKVTMSQPDRLNKTVYATVELLSASGALHISAPVTLRLSGVSGYGHAKFAANGSVALNVTTIAQGTQLRVPINLDGTATFQVTATTGAIFPSNELHVLAQSGHQTVLAAAAQTAATSASATFGLTQAAASISTKSSATGNAVSVGDTITDTVTVTGGFPGDTVSVTAELWKVAGPGGALPAQSANAPSGARKVYTAPTATAKLDAAGAATVTTGRYTVQAADGAGWYSWRVTLGGTDYTRGVTHPFSVPAESFSVARKTARIDSINQTANPAGPGDRVYDQITVGGGFPGDTVTVRATLVHLPLAVTDPAPQRTATRPDKAWDVVGPYGQTVKLDGNGNATVTVGGYTLNENQMGWLTWHVEVLTSASGNTLGAVADYGIDRETFRAVKTVGPSVATQTSAGVAAPGAALTDTLVVDAHTADLAAAPAVIESTLWGPFATRPAPSGNWPSDPSLKVGTVVTTATKAGTYTTPPVTVTAKGFYTWTAQIKATSQYEAFTSGFAEAAETTVVPWSPQVVTQTSQAVAAPGTLLTDHLALSGGRPGGSYTVISTLYGPLGDAPGLADAAPAGTPVVGSVTTVVTAGPDGAGAAETAGLTVTAPGYYVWVETIPADVVGSGTNGWTGRYGVATETIVVPFEPSLRSEAVLSAAEPGGEAHDVLVLAGGRPGGQGTLAVTLYGPFEVNPVRDYEGVGADEADEPDGSAPEAQVVKTFTTEVTFDDEGGFTYTTPALALTKGGYYVYSGIFTPAGDDMLATPEKFGEASETVFVPWQPAIRTRASDQQAMAGATLTDTLWVTGLGPGTGQVEAVLYGPFDHAPQPQTAVPDDAPVAGSVTVTVEGDGEYVTPGLEIGLEGYYTWVESLTPDGDGQVLSATSEFGLAEETTLVKAWEPSVVTKASTKLTGLGATIYDTGEISGLPATAGPVTIVTRLYGPFADKPELADAVPAGAPVAGQVETEVTGNGAYTTDEVKVTKPGYYTWVETITAAPGGGIAGYVGQFGVPDETVQVDAPPPTTVPVSTPPASTPPGSTPPPTSPTPGTVTKLELPLTGASPALQALAWLGLAFVLAGLGLAGASRRRRVAQHRNR